MTGNGWLGDHPYYLLIEHAEGATVIDLDEYQWATTHAALMRVPARWALIDKSRAGAGGPWILMIKVEESEQPYYTARHIGIASGSGGTKAEITAYGIGKKRLDGHVDRLWVLPNGIVCSGDDVEPLALWLIKGGK